MTSVTGWSFPRVSPCAFHNPKISLLEGLTPQQFHTPELLDDYVVHTAILHKILGFSKNYELRIPINQPLTILLDFNRFMALLSWHPCHHQKLGIWPRNVWRCGSAFPFLEGRSIKTPITSQAWDVSNCPWGPTVQPGEAMVISSVLWSNLQMTETEVLDPVLALVLEIIIDTIFTVSGWWTREPEYFQMHMHYV